MFDTLEMLQVDDTEVINFLLSTEIIPLCLRTMEMGSELSKTVATFIVQKILLDNVILCQAAMIAFNLKQYDQHLLLLSWYASSADRYCAGAGRLKLHLCHSREVLCSQCCAKQHGSKLV